jgi:FKBP-type peptidyl-prolyl cis-trans isomerase FklB
MKHIFAVILALGFLSTTCLAAEKVELKDQKAKESYSLGYQFGQSLKAQKVELNVDAYISALRDSLANAKPALSQEEMQNAIGDVQKRVTAARQKENAAKGEKNLAEGKAFLEENKKKAGVKTTASGLQYKVLTEGTGKSPKATDQVTVNYKGTLIDGTEFDSSYKRGQPATFPVNGVIPGWTEALQLMKVGSKWQLFIPSNLAYGSRDAGPIAPNSTLIFEVELLSIK